MQHPSAPLHLQQPQKGSVCTCRVCRGLSLLLAQSRDAQSSSEEPTAVTPPYSWEGRVIQDLGGGGTYLKVDENGAHGTTSRWRGAAAGPGRGGTRTGRVAPEVGAPPPHAPRARGSCPRILREHQQPLPRPPRRGCHGNSRRRRRRAPGGGGRSREPPEKNRTAQAQCLRC